MALSGRLPDLPVARFGPFELDLRTGELWSEGRPVKLQQQPVRVLSILITRTGELVTREELRTLIWGGDTYVDFDQSLNFCVKQIRASLGDQADTPRYVETLPRRGYRFVAAVEWSDRRGGLGGSTIAPPTSPAPAPLSRPEILRPMPARSRLAWTAAHRRWLAVAGGVALALGAGHALARRDQATSTPEFRRITFRRGNVLAARFAPTGDVAYSAAWDGEPVTVFTTREGPIDTLAVGYPESEVVGVAGPELALRQTRGERTLTRAPAVGGTPRALADDVFTADWSRDGETLAAWRVGPPGRVLEFPLHTVILRESGGAVMALRIAPSGDRVAYVEHPVMGDDGGNVVTVDRKGRKTTLSSGWASIEGLAWSSDGREVWFTATRHGIDTALHAVDLSGRERLIARAPGRLVLRDVAPDGRALLARDALRFDVRLSVDGGPERDVSWFDVPILTDLSGDASRILFTESGDVGGPAYGVYMRTTDGAAPVRVGDGIGLRLSPDGAWVLARSVGRPSKLSLLPTGPGSARPLPGDGFQYAWGTWTPDGTQVVFTASQGDGSPRTWVQDIVGGLPRPVTPERHVSRVPLVTPDGRHVVACAAAAECALHPLAGGPVLPLPGMAPADAPLAWDDGGATLYLGVMSLPARIDRLDVHTGRRTPWRRLDIADPAGVSQVTTVRASPARGAYAYAVGRTLSELYVVTGLR